jgi:hypothetical protein
LCGLVDTITQSGAATAASTDPMLPAASPCAVAEHRVGPTNTRSLYGNEAPPLGKSCRGSNGKRIGNAKTTETESPVATAEKPIVNGAKFSLEEVEADLAARGFHRDYNDPRYVRAILNAASNLRQRNPALAGMLAEDPSNFAAIPALARQLIPDLDRIEAIDGCLDFKKLFHQLTVYFWLNHHIDRDQFGAMTTDQLVALLKRDLSARDKRMGLDDNMSAVLFLLNDREPLLLTQEQIGGALKLHRVTVGKALAKLLKAHLCHQPRGPKKGWTVTVTGKQEAERLSAPRR